MFHFITHRMAITGNYFFTFVSGEGIVLVTSKVFATKEDCVAEIISMKQRIWGAKIHAERIPPDT